MDLDQRADCWSLWLGGCLSRVKALTAPPNLKILSIRQLLAGPDSGFVVEVDFGSDERRSATGLKDASFIFVHEISPCVGLMRS
jgi:hypothetical protein